MRVVLITGCSSGFGYEAALAFGRNGDTVYATVRSQAKGGSLGQAAAAESLDVRIVPLDVTCSETLSPLVERIVRESGSLDVLVNNAGILPVGALEDLEPAALRTAMETNVLAPLLLARAALPHMRRQRSGCIIMISSLSGVAGLPGDVAYSASKFALEGATEALRHEVDRWGIRVALVEPGLYRTRLFAGATGPGKLPASYPESSPYRPLIEQRMRQLDARLPGAFDPRTLGELLVGISHSDGRRLRWPADDTARNVLSKLFALDDAARDEFLRQAAGTEWWSAGRDAPAPMNGR